MSDYKIYPPIGIARVGNAPRKFYIGPEEYRGLPDNPDGAPFTEQDFRDKTGKLCRQAARFRLYRRLVSGAEEEVTLDTAGIKSITWTVHLANKKASWYEFHTNEGEYGYAPNHPLRNPNAPKRHKLIIDAGPRHIGGRAAHGVHFNAASKPPGYQGVHFPEKKLYPNGDYLTTLGELQTDPQGRLLVLGGLGIGGTPNPTCPLPDFANGVDWWDDTSDGPVSALIELDDGQTIIADAARVLVGPPAFAPQIPNLVTLWDAIFDTAVRHGHVAHVFKDGLWNKGAGGYRPNFQTEIGPLLERGHLQPWVVAIPPKPHHFDMEKLAAVPASPTADPYKGLRQWVFSFLRAPYEENVIVGSSGATMMPYLAGDNCSEFGTLTSQYLRLTDTQYFFLEQWAEGWFVDTPDTTPQPAAMTRAVLDNCVGGSFSSGMEMTWVCRNPAIYQPGDPYRITAALDLTGPLGLGFTPERMEPGDVTRYMAIPWHSDFNECSWMTSPEGRFIWWWPAQRPNFVYLEPAQPGAGDEPNQDMEPPVAWVGTDFDQARPDYCQFAEDPQMVQYWSKLGFVLEKTVLGRKMYVEVQRTLERPFFPPA